MFSRIILLSTVVALISTTVNGHAIVLPAMGVSGEAKRKDVQRPKTAKPCGKVAIALDPANSVAADAQGAFTLTAQNFNRNKDGSRQFTMQVDATGTGQNFVAGQVTQNGDLAPKTLGTQQITASLPAGTKCTGGASKNLCLVSFKSASGFGNCVVVSQGAQTQGGAANSTATDASAQNVDNAAAASSSAAEVGAAAAAADGNAAGGENGAVQAGAAAKGDKGKKAGKKANANKDAGAAVAAPVVADPAAVGTRAARAVRRAEQAAAAAAVEDSEDHHLEKREESDEEEDDAEEDNEDLVEDDSEDDIVAKRSLFGRIWA